MSEDSDIQIFNSVKSSVAVINIRIFFFTAVKLEASYHAFIPKDMHGFGKLRQELFCIYIKAHAWLRGICIRS